MKRKRVVLISIITFLTFLTFGTVLTPLSYTAHTVEATDSISLVEDAFIENDPPPLSLNDLNISLNESAIPASDTDWFWAATNTLNNDPYGTADNPSNLASDDGSLCRLSEEYDGSNYRIDLRFRTAAVYAHQYTNLELKLDFTQVWSLYPEDLKFYVCIATATGDEGFYYFVGQSPKNHPRSGWRHQPIAHQYY